MRRKVKKRGTGHDEEGQGQNLANYAAGKPPLERTCQNLDVSEKTKIGRYPKDMKQIR